MKSPTDHFSRVAPAYASCRPHYPEALFDYLFSLTPERELAWDCGAGTGQATLPLSRVFSRVVATDISAAMLQSAPRHPGIEYRVAPAHESGLGETSVDLVTVAQALHWFDADAFGREVKRVLKPGGVLAVWCYGIQRLDDAAIDAELERFYREVVGPYWTPERRHVENGYRTLPLPFPELSPPAFEMAEQWTLSELLGYIGTWSAVQRYRELLGADPMPDLAAALATRWGSPAVTRTVHWPLSLRVARKAHSLR